jgi:pimeloyl-ACP methyl ester carboxylesterase
MFDRTGKAVDPKGNAGENRHSWLLSYAEYQDHEYAAHIGKMVTAIKQWGTPPKDGKPGKRKLLFFIHGGLNTQVGSLERMIDPFDGPKTRVDLIKQAGYYPIFINWKSSLWSSYFEHLWEIRQGERWSWYAGIPSAMVVFPIDVTRSLVRAPLVWGQLVYSDFQTINNTSNLSTPGLSDNISAELLCRYNLDRPLPVCVDQLRFKKPPYCFPFAIEANPPAFRPPVRKPATDTFPIAVGEDYRRCTEMNLRALSYALTFPVKLAVSPILDTFGTSAWINMQRRIHLLFHSDDEMQRSPITERAQRYYELANIPGSGGLSLFMKELIAAKEQDKNYVWDVVLVGHSMGAIVLNEIIQLYGDKLPISNIIYLAAATSIEDYEDSVFPYLINHSETQFYNFMLHPIVEQGEIQYEMGDLPPRGSLLAWLDIFLANPETLLHRRVGRYDNYLRALHDTPSCDSSLCIRNRIHVRSFSAGLNEAHRNPQSHSEMAQRFRFWEAKCWKVDSPLEECIKPD